MYFQSHDAIDYLNTGCFQPLGQCNVGLFIITSFEFDNSDDSLSPGGGIYHRIDNGGVIIRSIECLFDRQYIVICRGLIQKPDNDVERFIGPVNQQILGCDGFEAIMIKIDDSLRITSGVRGKQEIRAQISIDQL